MNKVCIQVKEVMASENEQSQIEKVLNSRMEKPSDKPLNLQTYLCLEISDPSICEHLIQTQDVIETDMDRYSIDHVSFQQIRNGKWYVEFLSKKTFRSYNQSVEGGRILRETYVSTHSFQSLMDSISTKEEKHSCQIWYVDLKHSVKYYGRDVYSLSNIRIPLSSKKSWKYQLNEDWNFYKKKHQLTDACVSKLVFD